MSPVGGVLGQKFRVGRGGGGVGGGRGRLETEKVASLAIKWSKQVTGCSWSR